MDNKAMVGSVTLTFNQQGIIHHSMLTFLFFLEVFHTHLYKKTH